MDKLGNTFRDFRKKKSLTLGYVASDIMSTSMLSKFERGDSDITLSKIILLLNKLQVTLDEFIFVHFGYKKSEIKENLSLIHRAYYGNDEKTITKIITSKEEKLKDVDNIFNQLNIIMIKMIFSDLKKTVPNSQEIEIVTEYLWTTEEWGEYELTLYGNTLKFLGINSVKLLSKEVFKKSKRFSRLLTHSADIYGVLINTMIYFIEIDDTQTASEFLQLAIQSNIPERFQHELLIFKYFEGIILIKDGNINKGKDIAQKVIETFLFTNTKNTASIYQSYLDKLLNEVPINA